MRQRLDEACPGVRHRDIAEGTGMTPDAFSRALSGKRQFASIELARLAELTRADLHWLITGQPDPSRLRVAARHDFDHATGQRAVPGGAGDEQILADIALAYRQAYPEPETGSGPSITSSQFTSAAAVRNVLGPDFIRHFADRLEMHLGVGVVRVPGLSTAYALTIGGQPVIALPVTASWFRENWDIAHELGHLAQRHPDDEISEGEAGHHEAAANAFAAELLLPARTLNGIDWASLSDTELARFVWDWGVSTDALCRRLRALGGQAPARVEYWAGYPTQRLLRRHLSLDSERDEITVRMDQACQRRFPLSWQEAHLERVATGAIGRGTLAWMLGVDAAALDVDSPEIPEVEWLPA